MSNINKPSNDNEIHAICVGTTAATVTLSANQPNLHKSWTSSTLLANKPNLHKSWTNSVTKDPVAHKIQTH